MTKLLSKIFSITPPIAAIVGLEILRAKPELFWLIAGIILSIVATCSFFQSGFLKNKKWLQLNYLILPLFYTLGIFTLFIISQKNFSQHLFIIITSFLLGISIYNIKNLNQYRFQAHQKVILKSAEEKRKRFAYAINEAIVLITALFIFAHLFALIYLLSFSLWQILFAVVISAFFLTYQILNEFFKLGKSLLYASVVSLILGQIFWALTFWPTNYIANSLILIASLYITLGIIENYAHHCLTRSLIKTYFIIILITLGSVLVTNQWTVR